MKYIREAIAQMAGYVPGEQPQVGKVIKLNTNENPYPPSPSVIRAIETAARSGMERYPDPVANAFRDRAGDLLGVPRDWILCGNGSDDALTILARTFVDPGQLIRMPTPSYILYRSLAELQGARCEEVPFTSDWRLDERFVSPVRDLRLAFLPNPNSPSGTVLSPAEVLEIARQLPCPLVVDEAYVDFANEHCVSLVKQDERIIVTRTMSKSYALAGLRFGFLIAQPQLIEQMMKVKDSYNCDRLAIAAATAAIDDAAWLAETRGKIIATRATLTERLRVLGFAVIDSQANFVWATHPSGRHREFYERLKAQGVLIRYMRYEGWGDGLRISVGTDAQISVCMDLLAALI